MVSIFLRSLVYNVLFYALLVFWILVALPTFLMPPRAFMVGTPARRVRDVTDAELLERWR